MSFLGDLISDALGTLLPTGGRTDKKLERLMAEGELVPATIYAIKHVPQSETTDEWWYGLDLTSKAGPLRVTIRQMLLKEPERATLGSQVLARVLDGRVAIDWDETLSRAGVEGEWARSLPTKQLKDPIAPGIDDRAISKRRLERGIATEARIDLVEPFVLFGMATDAFDVTVTVTDAAGERQVRSGKVRIPPYAVSLATPGASVAAAIDPDRPDRVTYDWATTAERVTA